MITLVSGILLGKGRPSEANVSFSSSVSLTLPLPSVLKTTWLGSYGNDLEISSSTGIGPVDLFILKDGVVVREKGRHEKID